MIKDTQTAYDIGVDQGRRSAQNCAMADNPSDWEDNALSFERYTRESTGYPASVFDMSRDYKALWHAYDSGVIDGINDYIKEFDNRR